MGFEVKTGIKIGQEIPNFPLEDKEKIRQFVAHVQKHGLTGLEGRNKPSHEVPTDDPDWREKVAYAQQHHLWHYHIGIPHYDADSSEGDKTSEYLLHYIRGEQMIKIVDFTAHPPFRLPSEDYLV